MNSYGKLFRRYSNKSFDFFLRPYNPGKESYFQVIKDARNEGLRQVIINSEIMTEILYTTLQFDGVVLKITMSDNTDQDVMDNVKLIISKLKRDKLVFFKLKEELEWVADSGSIDIKSIDIYFLNKRYQINSDGIIHGDDLEVLFDKILEPVLEKYFYGG